MGKTTLEQTKGKFKVSGIVAGISNENAKREGLTEKGKKWMSLSFFVNTSPTNRVKVEIFGMERDHVYAYSQKAKDTKKIAWANRNDNHDDYKVLGVNAYLEKGTDGKNIRKVSVEYDVIEYITAHIKDGDSVRIQGAIEFSEYENKQGQKKEQQRFAINSITKLDEAIDFNSEKFKEEAIFEQDIVVSETMVDDENKKLIINALIIKYGGEIAPATFVVDATEYPKLANNMAKRLSLGDFIKVFGRIINSVIVTENTEPQETVADDDDWGGDEEVKKGFENNFIRDYIQELRITSVDSASYEQKKYNEEDLFSEDEDAFNGDVSGDSGGDDFTDEGEEEEIDDLPFN